MTAPTQHVTTRDGASVTVGAWVHYCGSLPGFVGQIMQVDSVYDGKVTLLTATGDRLRRVHGRSIRRCL